MTDGHGRRTGHHFARKRMTRGPAVRQARATVTDVEADGLWWFGPRMYRLVRAASNYHLVSHLETGRTSGSVFLFLVAPWSRLLKEESSWKQSSNGAADWMCIRTSWWPVC